MKDRLRYTVEDFMKNAKPCTLFKDVQEEVTKEMNSPEYQAKERQRLADVADLMHRVVGAEGFNEKDKN